MIYHRLWLSTRKKPYDILIFTILGSLQILIYWNLYVIGDLGQNIIAFLQNYLLLVTLYGCSIIFYRKTSSNKSPIIPVLLILFPIIFRVLMVLSTVSLSTDILRYVWDGMLLGNGIDPYKHVPSSKELEKFHNLDFYQIYDHKDEFTIYPPIAQLFFTFSYTLFGTSLIGFKSLVSLVDLINGFLIAQIIVRLRDDKSQAYHGALTYLWNPLVIIEFSHSGHLDAFAILLMLFSLYFLLNSDSLKSSILLFLSIFTKWIPLLMISLYVKYIFHRKRRQFPKITLSVILLSIIIVLPFYLSSGFNFITSMISFIQKWQYESSLFRILASLLTITRWGDFIYVKAASYLIFIILFLLLIYRVHSSKIKNIIDYSILVVALFLLILPRVYPWYTIWIIALISLTTWTWISIPLTGIIGLNYLKLFPNPIIHFFPDYLLNVLFILFVLVILLYYFRSNIKNFICSKKYIIFHHPIKKKIK